MIGSSESPDLECKWSGHCTARPASNNTLHCNPCAGIMGEEGRLELAAWGIREQPRPRSDLHLCGCGPEEDLPRACQPFATSSGKKNGEPQCHGVKGHSRQRWQGQPSGQYGSTVNLVTASNGSISSNSSSLESLGSPEVPKHWSESSRKQAGALQREMNALFAEKLEEIRSKSPMFFTGKIIVFIPASIVDHVIVCVSS